MQHLQHKRQIMKRHNVIDGIVLQIYLQRGAGGIAVLTIVVTAGCRLPDALSGGGDEIKEIEFAFEQQFS